jgi:glycerol-3-phosphate cytidylyltransferase
MYALWVGEEYKDKEFTGRAYFEENIIDLYFNKGNHRFTISRLTKEILNKQNQ